MDAAQTRANPNTTTALLFTNTQGQVIFVDQAFLHMMNYAQSRNVTGEPLHKALGLDSKPAKQLLEEVQKAGTVKDRQLHISGPDGLQLNVSCTAIATYDTRGHFIGADLTLRREREIDDTAPDHAAETIASRAGIQAAEDSVFVQLYFTTHVKALYILMARLVGLWVRDNLDHTINDASAQNGWPVQIKDGLFVSDLNDASPIIYRGLLEPTIDYAINMIGQKVVSKQVQDTDAQLHPGLLKLAEMAGLRELFNQRL